jgi:hypothetical protein
LSLAFLHGAAQDFGTHRGVDKLGEVALLHISDT